ncbi:hypothetical protein EE612_010101, partial [Oryza sativa]
PPPPTRCLPVLLLLLLVVAPLLAHGRRPFISGGGNGNANASVLRLPSQAAAGEDMGCEMSYGFLPCTTTAWGNLFLVLAYGFLMFKSATYLSSGSEMLLQILGPGIVGGLFLPILGALPDALLILGTPLPFPFPFPSSLCTTRSRAGIRAAATTSTTLGRDHERDLNSFLSTIEKVHLGLFHASNSHLYRLI